MTDYSEWKVLKSVINYSGNDEEKQAEAQAAQEEYTAVAEWCNENQQYVIADDGEYFKTAKIPEPTTEEKATRVRFIRNSYLERYVDPYVCNPLRWADLTPEEQQDIVNYRLYLLNVPEQPEFPDIEVKTFDEWKAGA
ncbi:MAG: hypothetical protein IKN71_02550 [Alphaproteobacteria bacterium]|nr:hypothetical protein [Alphaproteobacteria bacterium]